MDFVFQATLDVPEHTPGRDWPADGEILFENYSTRYRPELDLVVKNISVNISGGEKVQNLFQIAVLKAYVCHFADFYVRTAGRTSWSHST